MQIKRIPIVLDLQNKGQPILIPAKQADTGRILEFKICNGAEAVEIKNDPVLSVKKASGKKILNACSAENGNVLVKLTNQILAETGRQKAELIFKDDDGTVKSYIFLLDVEETTYDPDAIMSQNEFDALDKWAQEWDDRVGEVIKRADQQYEEMKKQAALIGDGNIGTVTGPRADFESLDSAAVVKEIRGKTVQDRSTGAQLFDASKLPTKTQGGATVTNNGDGSFTVSGNGNLSETFARIYSYSHEETLNLLKAGEIRLNQNGNTTPQAIAQLMNNSKPIVQLTKNTTSGMITQEMLNVSDCYLQVWIYDEVGKQIKPGTIKPMLYQDGDGTWEPYTGGKPTPRPDYPVMVQGVGDSGYFDGVLLQGYYSIVDGTLVGASDYICNENKIPCNSGDEISITVKKDGIEDFQFLFYEKNGTYIGNAPNWTAKAPEGTAFVCFRMKKTGLTTRNAGHIAITINGKYMTMIKSRTANLFDYRRLPSKTQGGATVTNNGDGTYQPYKESSSLIPITQPLYTGDKVYQKDGELWLHRENAEVTFGGSEDENWVLYNGQFYIAKDDMKKSNNYVDNLFCDRFQTDTSNSAKNDDTITGHWDSTLYPDKNWIYITKTDTESVSALKTWLQSNPVTVVYKLAVPIEERITAEEAYNLRTYAPYSTIWTPDDLEPEFLVDTAKNLAGSYALESYAQAKKNEMIKDNGSEMNLLTQKIEKIEELMKNALMISE